MSDFASLTSSLDIGDDMNTKSVFVHTQYTWLKKGEVIVGKVVDHVGINGSKATEGLSAFNVGPVYL